MKTFMKSLHQKFNQIEIHSKTVTQDNFLELSHLLWTNLLGELGELDEGLGRHGPHHALAEVRHRFHVLLYGIPY